MCRCAGHMENCLDRPAIGHVTCLVMTSCDMPGGDVHRLTLGVTGGHLAEVSYFCDVRDRSAFVSLFNYVLKDNWRV